MISSASQNATRSQNILRDRNSERFSYPARLLDFERNNDVSVRDTLATCGFTIYTNLKIHLSAL